MDQRHEHRSAGAAGLAAPTEERVVPPCPGCGMVNRPGAPVCRNCGLPIARPSDPLRGVSQGWFHPTHRAPSATMSALGVVLVAGVLVAGAMLTFEGGGVLRYGGRLGVLASASPSAVPSRDPRPSTIPGQALVPTGPGTAVPQESVGGAASGFTCDDTSIEDLTRSRWRVQTVRAGSRRRFDRVALDLVRTGGAQRRGTVTLEWMSPEEARTTFGLPRFDGRRGLLITFGRPFSTSGAQLIGPTDLRAERIESMSGVYRFVDRDGAARVYIALRDDSCARLTAPELENEGRPARRASILVDLRE